MACNFSQLKRRQSSNSLLGKKKSVTEEDIKDQFYRQVTDCDRFVFLSSCFALLTEGQKQVKKYWKVWGRKRTRSEVETDPTKYRGKLWGEWSLTIFFLFSLFQTIHAGIEPRKPLKVAFSPIEKVSLPFLTYNFRQSLSGRVCWF